MTEKQYDVRDAELCVNEAQGALALALVEQSTGAAKAKLRLELTLASLAHDVDLARSQLARERAVLDTAQTKCEKNFD